MNENLVRLTIKGIAMGKEDDLPIVILQNRHDLGVLPIQVGPFEANAIIIMLKGIRMPRMLTHELFAYFMMENKYTLTKLVIFGKSGDTYKATIFYKRGRRTRLLEVRPSDGIALALQFQSPIYAPQYLLVPQTSTLPIYGFDNIEKEETLFIENENLNMPLM